MEEGKHVIRKKSALLPVEIPTPLDAKAQVDVGEGILSPSFIRRGDSMLLCPFGMQFCMVVIIVHYKDAANFI